MTTSAAWSDTSISHCSVDTGIYHTEPYERYNINNFSGYSHMSFTAWRKMGDNHVPIRISDEQYSIRITYYHDNIEEYNKLYAKKDLENISNDYSKRLSDIDNLAVKLTYDDNFVTGYYYVSSNGSLATAASSKRIMYKIKCFLQEKDMVAIVPKHKAQVHLIYTSDGGQTFISQGWSASPFFAAATGEYYITAKFTDDRVLTNEDIAYLINSFKIIRSNFNNNIQNDGLHFINNLANLEKINFFNKAFLFNAYINTSTYAFTSDFGNKALYLELLPNTVYNIFIDKKPETDCTLALYKNKYPFSGESGINYISSSYNDLTFAHTIKTTDEYFYLGMKYATESTSRFTIEEVLDSIRIEIANELTEEVKNNLLNAKHQKGNLNTTLTLLHFSDLHADTEALLRISNVINKLNNKINDAICTGDIVSNSAGEISSWWNPNILTCIGNHDSASYSEGSYDWTALSMADRDAYYISPFKDNWSIIHTTGTSYYYKDYTTAKVRLIVLDSMLYTDNGAEATAQNTWLESLLTNAISNNLHVLIAIHSPHGGASVKNCSFSKYNQSAMPTNSDCNTPQSVIDIVATAITNGLHFIGYLVGHTHQDNIWDAENDGTQLMYCITCAAVRQTAQWQNSDQNRDLYTDAFNLITIDTQNTLIKLIRGGGANIDDHMRPRKALCINYSTGEIVGENL